MIHSRIHLIITILFCTINIYSQIIYKEFDPPLIPDGYSHLDFNNDSITDLTFFWEYLKFDAGCIHVPVNHFYQIRPHDTSYVYVDTASNLKLFGNGDTIQTDSFTFLQQFYCPDNVVGSNVCKNIVSKYFYYYTCDSVTEPEYTGLVNPINGKYFAFRININDNYHLCWVKISKAFGINLRIQSYGFNTVPDSMLVIDDPNPTDIELNKKDEYLIIYPNPCNNYLNIRSGLINTVVKIYDINGRMVFAGSYKNAENIYVDTEEWLKGLYFINIITSQSNHVRKIVKQ
jgi:hypothetical protein